MIVEVMDVIGEHGGCVPRRVHRNKHVLVFNIRCGLRWQYIDNLVHLCQSDRANIGAVGISKKCESPFAFNTRPGKGLVIVVGEFEIRKLDRL